MAKHVPAPRPVPRVMHYADPMPRTVQLVTKEELLARRAEQRALYARWAQRQAALAEHDAKVRRFWLGFGAVVGTGVLAGLGVAGWLIWHAVTATGLGLIAVPLAIAAIAGLAFGGHRCITTIQHWH